MSATDINLKLTNSWLNTSQIKVDKGTLHIIGSHIGASIHISDAKAVLKNCTVVPTNVAKQETLICATKSTIVLKSLHVGLFQGGSFLQVITGIVHIEDTVFVKCATADALISIVSNSVLSIEKCSFSFSDGHLVNLQNASTTSVNNSVFKGNKAFSNSTTGSVHVQNVVTCSVISAGDSEFVDCASTLALISVLSFSVLSVNNCTFAFNSGPLVSVLNTSTAIVSNSTFESNNVFQNSTQYTFHIISVTMGSMIIVDNSYFFKNNMHKGATVALENSNGIIDSSQFNGNTGTGNYAVAYVRNSRMIRVHRSTFSMNQCGGLSAINSSNIAITSSLFHGNSAQYGGGLALFFEPDTKSKSIKNTALETIAKFSEKNMFDQTRFKVILANSWVQYHAKQIAIQKCTFSQNSAVFGGAISTMNVSLTLVKNMFVNNSAEGFPTFIGGNGGAVELINSPTSITECIFDGNKGYVGGGLHADGASLKIRSSVFITNWASGDKRAVGGAIAMTSQHTGDKITLLVANSTFETNTATVGGAIYSVVLSIRIQGSTFLRNKANAGGAAVVSSANITDSFFRSNIASLKGGAVLFSTQMTIWHSNFTLNEASGGGAKYGNDNAKFSCHYCIFQSNKAGFRSVVISNIKSVCFFFIYFFIFTFS